MQFSDEILMAYADGEVDADTRRRIEAAMVSDPEIAERVARHRALRMDLGAAFGGVLDEPVPSRLLEAANSTPAETRSATVTDLNAARAAKSGAPAARAWSWPQWAAIAASLVIGVLAGRSEWRGSQSNMFATTSTGILATGALSAALDDQLSGSAATGDSVQIGLSFRSKGGGFCRSFTAAGAAGFACHEDSQWRVRALNEAGTHAAGGEYRMAGSELPQAVLSAIDDVMEGEALDRQQELEARERGWNK
jgi:hypothetical protein